MIKENIINTYLWFAYLPPKEIPSWLDDCITPENKGLTYTPEEAASRFDELFDKLLAENPAEKHIIPLSGGWDSRAILGALLERLDSAQIEAVTFGVPGQLDYDLGLRVSKYAGVKSNPIDLRTVEFTWDAILDSVNKGPWTYVPDGFFNQLAPKYAQDLKANLWSGFLGGTIFGSHLPYLDFNKQKRCKTTLQSASYKPCFDLNYDKQHFKMNLDDLLYFGLRGTNCMVPIIIPEAKWHSWTSVFKNRQTDYLFIAPFLEASWAGYWLTTSKENRVNKKLFLQAMNQKFPELFSLPSKSSLGLPLDAQTRYQLKRVYNGVRNRVQRKAPWLRIRTSIRRNYLDYDEMFRKRKDYKETLATAFDYLKSNEVVPWLDLDKLWKEHMKRRKDHGEAFQVLLGLAANLEVNGRML